MLRIAIIALGLGVLALLIQQQVMPQPVLVSAKEDNKIAVREFVTNLESDPQENSPSGQELPFPENPEDLVPEDLLPDHTADVEFAREHPLTQGNLLNREFLDVGFIAGVHREPLKNTNLSVRAEPTVERVQITPFNLVDSKPLPGHERLGFEIGGC